MGTLLAAVGLPLAGCSCRRKTFWILCGGDFGGVVAARETSVTVREIDRRVLLGEREETHEFTLLLRKEVEER